MKKNKILFWGTLLTIGFLMYFTGCFSMPSEKIGATLEETLGKPVAELEKMLVTTRAEFESLLGRRLQNNEVDDDGYFISNYPKTGLTTLFGINNGVVIDITIGTFSGQYSLDTLVRQTNDKYGNSLNFLGSYSWNVITNEIISEESTIKEGFTISIPALNRNANTFWVMKKFTISNPN